VRHWPGPPWNALYSRIVSRVGECDRVTAVALALIAELERTDTEMADRLRPMLLKVTAAA